MKREATNGERSHGQEAGSDPFLDQLRRKHAVDARRLSQNMQALAEMVDAAGWCAALATSDGSLWLSARAGESLGREVEELRRLPDLRAMLDSTAEVRVETSGESILIWSDARIPFQTLPAPSVPLSKRQTEVWQWIRRGKTAPEIALILGCALRTVETHIANLYRKIGVKNRGAAILGEDCPRE